MRLFGKGPKKRDQDGYSEFEPKFRRARVWSNRELRKLSHLFDGDVINVSGWADEDKEGGLYREYFSNARSYVVSNLGGGSQEGKSQRIDASLAIDLAEPLDPSYRDAFDLVFTHTVLEHVFEILTAVDNLCAMSRDAILTIVPFLQPIHGCRREKQQYADFWRFTPACLERLFEDRGFTTLYLAETTAVGASIYYFHLCSCQPDRWKSMLPEGGGNGPFDGGHRFFTGS